MFAVADRLLTKMLLYLVLATICVRSISCECTNFVTLDVNENVKICAYQTSVNITAASVTYRFVFESLHTIDFVSCGNNINVPNQPVEGATVTHTQAKTYELDSRFTYTDGCNSDVLGYMYNIVANDALVCYLQSNGTLMRFFVRQSGAVFVETQQSFASKLLSVTHHVRNVHNYIPLVAIMVFMLVIILLQALCVCLFAVVIGVWKAYKQKVQ